MPSFFLPGLTDCQRCHLRRGATRVVSGDGTVLSPVVFIGEGPGKEEDEQGRPFVGRAGQLLTKILTDIGVSREHVYITNVVKCRPPQNRTPKPEEIQACRYWLDKELKLIKPAVVIALGATAYSYFGGRSLSKNRGQKITTNDFVVIPTFHPAYLLRNQSSDIYNKVKRDILQAFTITGDGCCES